MGSGVGNGNVNNVDICDCAIIFVFFLFLRSCHLYCLFSFSRSWWLGLFKMLGYFSFLWYKGGVENNFNVSLPYKDVIKWLAKKVAWSFFVK